MATSPTVDVDVSALAALVRALQDGPARLHAISLAAMKDGAERIAKRSRALVTNDVLAVRTGQLRRSISSEVTDSGGEISARVGILAGDAVLKYAAIQEYGGTVTPKNAKVLTIPLEASLTPAGVPRWTAPEASEKYLTFWHKTQGGALILFGYAGSGKNVKDRQLIPLFVGVTSVTIPAAHYLSRAVDENVPTIAAQIQAQIIAGLFGEAGPTGAIASE